VRAARRARIVAWIILLAVLAGSCDQPPPATPSPTAATLTPTASASPTASATPTVGSAIPPLLVYQPSGASAGLWRLDPNSAAPSPPLTKITTPLGSWTPTSSSRYVALTAVGSAPVNVLMTTLSGDRLDTVWAATLPAGEMWDGGHVECISADGLAAIGDAGLTISILDRKAALTPIPDQRNNLGDCTWLDSSTLLFDQEGSAMAIWRVSTTSPSTTAVPGRSPSAAAGRLAWYDEPAGTVRVAVIELSPSGFAATRELGHLDVESPSNLALSGDGMWLVVAGIQPDTATIFAVSENGVTKARELPFATGMSISWLPTSP
jgi:hypothetical protein